MLILQRENSTGTFTTLSRNHEIEPILDAIIANGEYERGEAMRIVMGNEHGSLPLAERNEETGWTVLEDPDCVLPNLNYHEQEYLLDDE